MAGNIMRMSGMVSGMDTDSLVTALSSSYKTKVDKAKKAQTKLEWKQDAWKDMNTKIYGLYSGKLSSMRFTTAYNKKATKVSSNALTVTAGANAVDGVQTAKIKSMAKAAYLTGGEIKDLDGGKVTNDTKLTDLGLEVGSTITISSIPISLRVLTMQLPINPAPPVTIIIIPTTPLLLSKQFQYHYKAHTDMFPPSPFYNYSRNFCISIP